MRATARPLYVAFRKVDGSRCCSFDTMKELLECHPPEIYEVIEYVPRKEAAKRK